MSQTITIDPVTRLEGHGKITIQLNGQGEVEDAHFHVTQVRGFEKFSEGRPFYEMPSLMARICGICPVSHLHRLGQSLRSHHVGAHSAHRRATAADVEPGADGAVARAQLLLSLLARPAAGHGVRPQRAQHFRRGGGQARARPRRHRTAPLRPAHHRVARQQAHPSRLGGARRRHRAARSGTSATRFWPCCPRPTPTSSWRWTAYKQIADTFKPEIEVFANFPSNYLGLINEDESIEFTDGALRLIDPQGKIIEDGITASRFTEVIGEAVEHYSYTKFAYYKPLGYPEGSYRVGPLARLNIVKTMGTPQADKELAEFKQLARGPVESSFHYHHARLVEMLYGIEKIEEILTDPLILDKHVRATAGVNRLEGAGQAEAPRGTLHHHYKVDENGKMTWANLVIATGQNNNAMNRGVLQAAKALREGRQVHRGRSEPRRSRGPHL